MAGSAVPWTANTNWAGAEMVFLQIPPPLPEPPCQSHTDMEEVHNAISPPPVIGLLQLLFSFITVVTKEKNEMASRGFTNYAELCMTYW